MGTKVILQINGVTQFEFIEDWAKVADHGIIRWMGQLFTFQYKVHGENAYVFEFASVYEV